MSEKTEKAPEPLKQEKVVKKQVSEEVVPDRQPTVIVSNTDAYIYDRLKGQPKTLDEVANNVDVIKKEGKHQLSLPDEIEALTDRFAFRWLMKNKKAIDYACDVRGWVLVTRAHLGGLPNHLFTVNGTIERGDTILAYMSKARAEKLRQEPGKLSREIVKSQFNKHKNDPRYYVPKDEEAQHVVGI